MTRPGGNKVYEDFSGANAPDITIRPPRGSACETQLKVWSGTWTSSAWRRSWMHGLVSALLILWVIKTYIARASTGSGSDGFGKPLPVSRA